MPEPQSPTFQPTRWSLIAQARSPQKAEAHAALERLCAAYWYPLYAYVRRCGQSHDDALDVTQGFFAKIIERDLFAGADPERGKLRTFLLVAMQNFLREHLRHASRQKRGGGATTLSIDEALAENRYAAEPADRLTPEAIYNRRWALTLLEETMSALREEYEQQGKAEVFAALKPILADPRAVSFAEIGATLGISEGAARVAAFRLRQRYRARLLECVSESLENPTPEAIEEEISALFRALA